MLTVQFLDLILIIKVFCLIITKFMKWKSNDKEELNKGEVVSFLFKTNTVIVCGYRLAGI